MAPILILDGGLGTSLERNHGVKFSHSTPLWSSHLLVHDPATLLACQSAFGLGVPVDIIQTATYQVSIEGFTKTNPGTEAPALATSSTASSEGTIDAAAINSQVTENTEAEDTRVSRSLAHAVAVPGLTPATDSTCTRGIPGPSIPAFLDLAVTLAEKAKLPHTKVALSIGPYGACMIPSQEYSGVYDAAHNSSEALELWHRQRLALFSAVPEVASRVSFVALETVPRVDEIWAMRRALQASLSLSDVPCWISCLFPADDPEALPDGTSVDAAVTAMLEPHPAAVSPWGIGINCTKTSRLDQLLRRYEATITRLLEEGYITAWPALVLYPDGTNGEVYNTTTQQWERPIDVRSQDQRPWEVQLAEIVRHTDSRGHWSRIVVGGCCMSSHQDIESLRKILVGDAQHNHA